MALAFSCGFLFVPGRVAAQKIKAARLVILNPSSESFACVDYKSLAEDTGIAKDNFSDSEAYYTEITDHAILKNIQSYIDDLRIISKSRLEHVDARIVLRLLYKNGTYHYVVFNSTFGLEDNAVPECFSKKYSYGHAWRFYRYLMHLWPAYCKLEVRPKRYYKEWEYTDCE